MQSAFFHHKRDAENVTPIYMIKNPVTQTGHGIVFYSISKLFSPHSAIALVSRRAYSSSERL